MKENQDEESTTEETTAEETTADFFQAFYDEPDLFIIYGFLGFCTFAIVFLGGVLASGIIAGLFTAISMLIVMFKTKNMAPRIWNTICKYNLLVDVLLSALIVAFTATGVIGIIAGVTGALFTTIGLRIGVKGMGPVENYDSYSLSDIPGFNLFNKTFQKFKTKFNQEKNNGPKQQETNSTNAQPAAA